MKIAIVTDWLTTMGGAERVVLALHKAYPDAPIFTSVYEPSSVPLFADADVRTTWLQRFPGPLRRKHQLWPVLRAHAFKHVDLSDYDVVISCASAEAKAVRVRPSALHVCYCHTPTRYYWSHYHEYLRRPGFGPLNPLIRLIMPGFVAWMRKLDLQSAAGVTEFIANSHEVQARIQKYYHRDSTVIYPPVDIARLTPEVPVTKEDFYVVVGRQMPYKRIDLAVAACNQLGKRLIVIGSGSEHQKLWQMAGPTIELYSSLSDEQVVSYLQRAKAFLFPTEEDFGIAPVEAMAAGTPVIAYKKGGALDYVVEGKTGVFFTEQNVDSLTAAITSFEGQKFDSRAISTHAKAFGEERFLSEIQRFIQTHR